MSLVWYCHANGTVTSRSVFETQAGPEVLISRSEEQFVLWKLTLDLLTETKKPLQNHDNGAKKSLLQNFHVVSFCLVGKQYPGYSSNCRSG